MMEVVVGEVKMKLEKEEEESKDGVAGYSFSRRRRVSRIKQGI